MFFLLGLHVFPTFVIYELTVLLFLTLSVVIMKVFFIIFLKSFNSVNNLSAACHNDYSSKTEHLIKI